ncbi:MAG: hypothetical protein IT211_04040 [Armatimonadetes bacterium]|nr:hypothetical protein [Armatimonadota bacterium]
MAINNYFPLLIAAYAFFYCSTTSNAQQPDWITHINYTDSQLTLITALDCADSANCVIVRKYGFGYSDTIYRTTDGGLRWNPIPNHYSPNFPYPRYLSIAYPSSNLILACGDSGLVLRSSDGGLSWESKRVVSKQLQLEKIIMSTPQHGIISVNYIYPGYIMTTSDSGRTWDSINVPVPPGVQKLGLSDIHSPTPNVFYCLLRSDTARALARSDNGGATWTYYSQLPPDPIVIYFTSSMNGWLLSIPQIPDSSGGGARDVISKTTNGGATWETSLDTIFESRLGLSGISFADSLNGLVTGNGRVYRTSDGGNTWKVERVDYSNIFRLRVSYKPHSKGVLVDAGGRVFRYVGQSSSTEVHPIDPPSFYLAPNAVSAGVVPMLSYQLPKPAVIGISIVSLTGEETILQQAMEQDAGLHQLPLQIGDLPSGLYFIRINNHQQNRVIPFQVVR